MVIEVVFEMKYKLNCVYYTHIEWFIHIYIFNGPISIILYIGWLKAIESLLKAVNIRLRLTTSSGRNNLIKLGYLYTP